LPLTAPQQTKTNAKKTTPAATKINKKKQTKKKDTSATIKNKK
jgi:hypothetical protein